MRTIGCSRSPPKEGNSEKGSRGQGKWGSKTERRGICACQSLYKGPVFVCGNLACGVNRGSHHGCTTRFFCRNHKVQILFAAPLQPPSVFSLLLLKIKVLPLVPSPMHLSLVDRTVLRTDPSLNQYVSRTRAYSPTSLRRCSHKPHR